MVDASGDDALLEALGASQRLGFFGGAPLPEILAHARRFVAAIPADARRVIDVGSGGGLPGLVIAWDRPEVTVTLVDRRATRMDAVRRLVTRLGLRERVSVVTADVVDLLRAPGQQGSYDVVTARGLGAPAVTAEWCRPLLRTGGRLLVSEPPAVSYDRRSRWPDAGLAVVGLRWEEGEDPAIARLVAVEGGPNRPPRRRPTPPLF